MSNVLRDGLIITVVGMGLVFAALALLWGMMAAMHRLFPAERGSGAVLSSGRRQGADESSMQGQTVDSAAAIVDTGASDEELAAIVVALARWREAEAVEGAIGWRLPPLLTRWMAVGRGRQVQSWTPRR